MCPVTRVFAVETNLSFWWDLETFSQKKCAQSQVSSLCRLSQVFDGTWKNFHEKVCPITRFFAVETNLSFWCDLESFDKEVWAVTHFFRSADCLQFLMGLRKIPTKLCAQLHVFSLWRLTWVFDGTWKNFHKKVCPVICFFAVETMSSFWWDLESFDKKVWSATRFFAVQTISSFWWDLEKFQQNCVPSYTCFRCGD